MIEDQSIPRKWQYITDVCDEQGYTECATLARAIDKDVVATYGTLHTDAWAHHDRPTSPTYWEINDIVMSGDCCTPCVVSGGCENCGFAALGMNRLYHKFLTVFKRI